MKQFIVRLDDASPTMVEERWKRMYQILKNNRVKPLVGVIPHNEDPSQQNPEIPNFWEMMREWQADGATIALHGYNHCYISKEVGVNPLWNRSEFAGVPYEVQKQKIDDGFKILVSKGLMPTVFFAPSHTYDENTLKCLEECTTIRIISDTIALMPYRNGNFVFVPQQAGHFMVPKLPGVWTFCFHPNTMTDEQILVFERFIKKHKLSFISIQSIDIQKAKHKGFLDKFVSWIYFKRRFLLRTFKLLLFGKKYFLKNASF